MKVNPKHIYLTYIFLSLLLTTCNTPDLPSGVSFYPMEIGFVSIDWSLDSQQLVGSSPPLARDDVNTFRSPSEIYIWSPYTGVLTQVSDSEKSLWNSNPIWNSTSSQVLFYSQTEFGNDYKIGLVDIDSKISEGITKFGLPMDWFSDGSKIMVSNGGDIFTIDTHSKEILLPEIWSVPNGEAIRDLSLSSDDKKVALLLRDDGRYLTQLYVIDIINQSVQKFFERPILTQVSWSSNNQWILVMEDRYKIRAIKSDNNCTTDPLPIAIPKEAYIGDFQWSPDGQNIAMTIYGEETGIYLFDTGSQFIQDWLTSGSCFTVN